MGTTLGCSVHNCINNEGGLCGAEYILIEGEDAYTSSQTYCSNYKEETIMNGFRALGNTDFIGEIMQMVSDNSEIKFSPTVACHAKSCFYNGNGKCEARNLIIVKNTERSDMLTQCETFIESH